MLVSDHRNVPGGKERRKKQLLAVTEMIQDEIPPAKPVVKLVFWLPVSRLSMIQDEITLRRVVGTTFDSQWGHEADDTIPAVFRTSADSGSVANQVSFFS